MPSAPLTSVLTGMSTIGMFSSRAFVSAFAVAAMLKWGPQVGWINNLGLLQHISHVPTWFTHDLTVTLLGLLAALEIAATKSPDARMILNEVDGYIKSSTAFVTTLTVAGVLSANDAAVINNITAWVEPVRAGFGDTAVGVVTATLSAIGVWFACVARSRLLGVFIDADPDDDTMVLGLLSWAEDLWAFMGTLLLFLFPLFMLAVVAILLSGLWLLQWRARRREEKSRIPCTSCSELMYTSAVQCPGCNVKNAEVHAVGWLGQSRHRLASSLDAQPNRLVQKQRCPRCATTLRSRHAMQACTACGHTLFETDDDAKQYLDVLDTRLPLVLIVSGLLSCIPVVGLIPAIMVYRLKLISPIRRYTAMTRTIPLRWGIRLLFFVLIWLQVVPVLGAFAVPLMAFISYGAYRTMFLSQLERERKKASKTVPRVTS